MNKLDRLDRFTPYLCKLPHNDLYRNFTQNGAKPVQPVQPVQSPSCGRQNDVI